MKRHRAFLAASALAAANTALAARIPALPGTPGTAVWAATWPVAELPGQYLGAQAVATGAALVRGAASTSTGRAALALNGATMLGLALMRRRAAAAGAVLDAALVEGLGSDYGSRVVRPRHPGPGAADAGTPGVYRMARIRSSYAHDADISYGPAGKANLLDVWRRPDLPADAKAPVLLQIPGGAWTTGNKQAQAYPLMSHLAERGWVCVAVNYRLSPGAVWPAHIVDVKRALTWVRANIGRYGGDPGFVAVTGGSAGGHLSALAALTPNDPAFQPGFEDADTTVQAAVPFYGQYGLTEQHVRPETLGWWEKKVLKQPLAEARRLYEEASPIHRVRPDAPPFFLIHGASDVLLYPAQARAMARALRKTSTSPVVYAELPGATHSFDTFGAPRATAAAHAVERFLGVAYGEWLRTAPQSSDPR
jgi:acetyl esterase/lipase